MPIKCNIDLKRLNNTQIEIEDNTYVCPKSATRRQKMTVHLHLIYDAGRLTKVVLTFPDFSSGETSGYIHDHVDFAKVSTNGQWIFEERPVFHALASMRASSIRVAQQIWKVGNSLRREEKDSLKEQVLMAKIYCRYSALVYKLFFGVQEAAGNIDLSSLNAGQAETGAFVVRFDPATRDLASDPP